MNQVIHHFDTQNKNKRQEDVTFPNTEKAFNEIYRLLRKGGVYMINMTFPR